MIQLPSDCVLSGLNELNLGYLRDRDPQLYSSMLLIADKKHLEHCPGRARISMAAQLFITLPCFGITRDLRAVAKAYKIAESALRKRVRLFGGRICIKKKK